MPLQGRQHSYRALGGPCQASPNPQTPKPGRTKLGHLLTLGLQVTEQVPQLALLGQALAVTDVFHTHVQAACGGAVWGLRPKRDPQLSPGTVP